jgi:hypothetical protein
MNLCFNCRQPWESTLRQPAVKETCSNCNAYLHCCRNCRFHRKGYPNECYIPDTEKIADKTRANFCDEFEFYDEAKEAKRRAQGREALSALFGEEEDSGGHAGDGAVKEWCSESDNTISDFDDLFKD